MRRRGRGGGSGCRGRRPRHRGSAVRPGRWFGRRRRIGDRQRGVAGRLRAGEAGGDRGPDHRRSRTARPECHQDRRLAATCPDCRQRPPGVHRAVATAAPGPRCRCPSRSAGSPPSASPGTTPTTSTTTRSPCRCAASRTAPGRTGRTLPYDADHGPDPGSAEARGARNGTDAVVVGDVDDVQVRAVTADGATLPDDMSLAIVDPGETVAAVREKPAIDTARLASADTVDPTDPVDPTVPTVPTDPVDPTDPTDPVDPVDPGAELVGTPADVTPRPQIFSRAQWGADERMRDKSSLHYSEVHAGFVHHTVNANGYTKAEVPSILRGIYAYHTQSRGWSDIGYNFLVDRFGRIWEGRFGGVDRPVVGAHTLNYNDERVRDVGDRQLRHHPARRRDAAGLRPAVRVEAQPARHLRLVEAAVGARPVAAGDQRPPRRRQDRVPGQVPLRQDPADPAVRRRRPASVHQPRQGQRPRRHPLAGPRRAREGHQQGLRRAHRRPGRLRPRRPRRRPDGPAWTWSPRPRTSPATASPTCSRGRRRPRRPASTPATGRATSAPRRAP